MMRKFATLVCLIFITLDCAAELTVSDIQTKTISLTSISDKTFEKTGISFNEDDIVATEHTNSFQLTETQLFEAKVWGLTLDEEKRYIQLMQSRSHYYYNGLNLTPVDILGINARDENERNHFAALAAAQEAQKVAKNIAWNNAFYKAYNRLFDNVPVVGKFNASTYAPITYQSIQLKAKDNLYLFVKPNDPIRTVLLTLISTVKTTTDVKLHIMLLEASDVAIQIWANQHQIPQSLVIGGQISLNNGDFNFNALDTNPKISPLLLLARAGSSRVVDLGKF